MGVDPEPIRSYLARTSPRPPVPSSLRAAPSMPYFEELFRLSDVPTHPFVPPDRYDENKVSVRAPERCLRIIQ
jgi:hypothetical protein